MLVSENTQKRDLTPNNDFNAASDPRYNLAFITPLIFIFAMAFTGMSNKALIDFQTRHTFSVKIALGLVFLALAAVILFGARMM